MTTATKVKPDKTPAKRSYGELVLAALLGLVGLWMLLGRSTIQVIGETIPGPLFLPTGVGIGCLVLAAVLAADVFAKPQRLRDSTHNTSSNVSTDLLDDLGGIDEDERHISTLSDDADADLPPSAEVANPPTDWKTWGAVVVAFVLTIAVLPYLGWILTSSLLFFAISQVLGGKNWARDLAISFIVGSVTYFIFALGLGLNLPAGFLGGI